MKHLAFVAVALTACSPKAPPTDDRPLAANKNPAPVYKGPAAGDSCDWQHQAYCSNDTTLLKCIDGKFVKHYCDTCTKWETGSAPEAGENRSWMFGGCVAAVMGEAGAACSLESRECNGATMVVCDGKKFRTETCGGPKGCVVDKQEVNCDTTVGDVGEPCYAGSSCARDGKSLLYCEHDAYVTLSKCHGEDAQCGTYDGSLRCNHKGIGDIGEPCSAAECSPDGKSLNACVENVLKAGKKCKKGCASDSDTPHCN